MSYWEASLTTYQVCTSYEYASYHDMAFLDFFSKNLKKSHTDEACSSIIIINIIITKRGFHHYPLYYIKQSSISTIPISIVSSTMNTNVDENDIKKNDVNLESSLNNEDDNSTAANEENPQHDENNNASRIILEDFTRFSKSMIWDLMMKFYDKNGISSWSNGIVPHFISSNPYIGHSYAKLISGYVIDLCNAQRSKHHDQNDVLCYDEPLYIVEVGGGTGKLAFYILKALDEMKYVIEFPFRNIVYVLTDFTESNIKFWEQNESFKLLVDLGKLDFAKFEAVNDTTLHLRSGKIIRKGDLKNPMIVIANYLIDTLCHDVYQIDNGILKEGLISVGVKDSNSLRIGTENNFDTNDPEIIHKLWNEYEYKQVNTDHYSNLVDEDDSIHFSRILSWYERYFKESNGASLLIPIGFLSAIRHLSDLSDGKALVITGDKGNSNPDYFCGKANPHMALHGSFSLMVNFHCIDLYVISRGGFSLIDTQEESSFQVNCFIINSHKNKNEKDISNSLENLDKWNEGQKSQYPMLTFMFQESVNNFSPNDFFVMQKSLKEEKNPQITSILSLLKLSHWDPDVFYKFRDEIIHSLSSSSPKLRHDFKIGTKELWENYYHLDNNDNSRDILFELGRLCYGLSVFDKALNFYKLSLEYYGDHHITYHNSGLCHFSLGHFEAAQIAFGKAIEISPSYDKSKTWFERVEKELTFQTSNTISEDRREIYSI